MSMGIDLYESQLAQMDDDELFHECQRVIMKCYSHSQKPTEYDLCVAESSLRDGDLFTAAKKMCLERHSIK
jgi:hypothetical protein